VGGGDDAARLGGRIWDWKGVGVVGWRLGWKGLALVEWNRRGVWRSVPVLRTDGPMGSNASSPRASISAGRPSQLGHCMIERVLHRSAL